jgi:hypothetical protein
MTSGTRQSPSPAIRLLLLVLSLGTVLGALLSLSGAAAIGYWNLVPFTLMFLVLRALQIWERVHEKKEAPGRAGRPGAEGR